MTIEKGNLSIHSENIFPIIKKWLYSDHDIFIRELISNCCDAITKVKRLSSLGEADLKDDKDFSIKVILDKDNETLKFIDNGIGMTDEEIKKYINQIAFSGAEDFFKAYKDKAENEQIIGHFGLGFYSSFMVSDSVEINTLSYKEDAKAVRWLCDGGTEFEMNESDKISRGTEITLNISEDGKDFLDEHKVKSTIEKYCNFMPYPIYFEVANKEPEKDNDGNIIIEEPKPLNDTVPLYTKRPNECTDEEYKEFYSKTFRDFKEPLFWIHLNMDYPFNLKGILYFPKLNNNFDTLEGEVKLYNTQVFIADNIKEVVPEFLLLLKGVIDCPDLPLNVSRSFLQNDGFVKKTSDYITKKVADKLVGMFKTSREDFEKFWDDISPFVKFGIIKNNKFADKVKDIVLYKTNKDNYLSVNEYLEKHTGKLENEIYYATDTTQQAQYINLLDEHGIEVVLLDHNIDQAFISHVESANTDVKFKRVDSDLSSLLTEDDENVDEEANKDTLKKMEDLFKSALGVEKMNIDIKTLKNDDVSSMILLSESNRRMQDMMKMYSMGMDQNMFPSEETLVLNKKHPLVKYIIEKDDNDTSSIIAKQLYDLAMISHKPLSPEAMSEFIKRSNEIMKKII
ncbi:molecular chaperone HtpG [Clostridiaceae bacterium M8S5]|nr:molecular chaperone HtpG [Clostridiaceae bacterium M8S5]